MGRSGPLRQPRQLPWYFLQFLRRQFDKNRGFEILNAILLFGCRFHRAMLCMRGTSHGPVSVCLSVTSRSSTKTAKR